MAKEIDNYTASLITTLGSSTLSADNISALDAVKLSTRGFIEITNDSLTLTSKAKNALRRFEREQKIEEAIEAEELSEPKDGSVAIQVELDQDQPEEKPKTSRRKKK